MVHRNVEAPVAGEAVQCLPARGSPHEFPSEMSTFRKYGAHRSSGQTGTIHSVHRHRTRLGCQRLQTRHWENISRSQLWPWTTIANTNNAATWTLSGKPRTAAASKSARGSRARVLPLDVTGPRLPRLVQTVVASRCYNCVDDTARGHRLSRELPEVQRRAALLQAVRALRALHAVPVPEAVPADRDEGPGQRVRVVRTARDGGPGRHATAIRARRVHRSGAPHPSEARAAFDNLFKK